MKTQPINLKYRVVNNDIPLCEADDLEELEHELRAYVNDLRVLDYYPDTFSVVYGDNELCEGEDLHELEEELKRWIDENGILDYENLDGVATVRSYEHLASAIINGDVSGLDTHDHEDLDDFCDHCDSNYPNWSVNDVRRGRDNEIIVQEFDTPDHGGRKGKCIDYVLHRPTTTEEA